MQGTTTGKEGVGAAERFKDSCQGAVAFGKFLRRSRRQFRFMFYMPSGRFLFETSRLKEQPEHVRNGP